MADNTADCSRIRKSVSFAERNQFYLIEYQEPIATDDDHSLQNTTDIESMTSGDDISANVVSYDTLDRCSAGTALDTSDFNTFPQRLSMESSGPGGFSMDEVVRRLFAYQESIASPPESVEVSGYEQDSVEDVSTDDSLSDQRAIGQISREAYPWRSKIPPLSMCASMIEDKWPHANEASERADTDSRLKSFHISPPESAVDRIPAHTLNEYGGEIWSTGENIINLLASGTPDVLDAPLEWIADGRTSTSPTISSRAQYVITIDTTRPNVEDSRRVGYDPNASPFKLTLRAQISQSDKLSAAQLRRHGRVNKQLSIALDVSNGVVKYSMTKVLLRIFLLWMILPAGLCILSYGVIPYDYFDTSTKPDMGGSMPSRASDRVGSSIWAPTIVPWLLIMCCAASLSLEIYSYIVAEIEFGTVLWETSPRNYYVACFISVTFSICTQVIIFESNGAGSARNWLSVMVVGNTSIVAVLCFIYFTSRSTYLLSKSPESVEATKNFFRFLIGNFLLLGVSGVGYTLYAIIFAQFSSRNGNAVGIALAFVFPFLRLLLNATLQNCIGLQWGSKKGYLCAGRIVAILTSMWHGAFGCLIISTTSTIAQSVTFALVEILIQGRALSDIVKAPYIVDGNDDLDLPVEGDVRLKGSNRSPSQLQMLSSWRSKGSVAIDSPSHINRDISLSRGTIGTIDFKNFKPQVGDRPIKVDGNHSMSRETSVTINANSLATQEFNRTRPRIDEAREIQLSNWLIITWTNGILTPLCFLACCAALSTGLNKRLFVLDVVKSDLSNFSDVLTRTSNWEIEAHLRRVWNLNIFNGKQGPSRLVYKLLLISVFHVILSFIGIAIMSAHKLCLCSYACRLFPPINLKERDDVENQQYTRSRMHGDLLGLMSVLLENHYNILAISSVMTLSIVFSVVFPWYGMNCSF